MAPPKHKVIRVLTIAGEATINLDAPAGTQVQEVIPHNDAPLGPALIAIAKKRRVPQRDEGTLTREGKR